MITGHDFFVFAYKFNIFVLFLLILVPQVDPCRGHLVLSGSSNFHETHTVTLSSFCSTIAPHF